MQTSPVLTEIRALITGIEPCDATERTHVADALAWLDATDDVFRRTTHPAEPAKHLVSYFLLVDPADGAVLLGDHRKSGLWLPSGGHVEPGEHPVETVRRECVEELGVPARFLPAVGARPLLLTVTETRTDRHVDVSLWFVLAHAREEALTPDPREYAAVRWWTTDEVRAADPERFDPHLPRMLDKLGALPAS
jgi:8-oxo-dGTP pyrophosphatase MutT (NUDIX family)